MIARLARSLALLLLAWQAMVVQAHQHAPAGHAGAPAVSSHAGARSTPASDRSDGPLDCPVCRTLAHVDAYVSPGPLAFAPPATVATWASVAPRPARLRERRSHAWRSRAPPVPLHT